MRKNQWYTVVERAQDVNEAITVRELLTDRYKAVPNITWEFKAEGLAVKCKGFTSEYAWRGVSCIAEGIIVGYRSGYSDGYDAGYADSSI